MRFFILFLFLVHFCYSNQIGYFWVVTDVHIDLFYKEGADPIDCEGEILCCRKFHTNQTQRAPKYGPYAKCDQPAIAVQEHFNFIKEHTSRMSIKPDFVLHLGDDSPHDNDVQTRETNLRASKVVYEMLTNALQPVPIYSVLGNHECYPVDQLQEGEKGRWLLNYFADMWSKVLPPQAIATVRKGGYYSLKPTKGLRLMFLNTQWMDVINFYSYKNETHDLADQWKWMETELEEATKEGEKVFIVSHFPPTYPGYLEGFANYIGVKLTRYVEIIKKYQKNIIFSTHGHKHTDYFNLFVENEEPYYMALMGSAMTPWQNRNPGVRLYKYDKSSFKLLDYTEFYTNIGEANRNGKVEWKESYNFLSEYGMNELSPKSLYELLKKFQNDHELFKKWNFNKSSKHNNYDCNGSCKKQWICMMKSNSYDQLSNCLKN